MFLIVLTSCSLIKANAFSINGYSCSDMSYLLTVIEEQERLAEAAHQMAESARTLGYKENHSTIVLAKEEYQAAIAKREQYQTTYDELMVHWQSKREEYPTATYIWGYFKSLGYSDVVCAGILGNMMAEVGGQTLNLNYQSGNNNYYGLCQWNKAYSEVWGTSLTEQCAFLQNSIQYEFNTYGYAYKKNFNYESFMKMTSAEDAAKAFAVCYERCGKASYKVRQSNASAAYEYFTS